MKIRVLVVDDSGFFRGRLVKLLHQDTDFEVVGVAANGQEALERAAQLKPDVVTMDVEMPVMDGITAVRHMMRTQPLPVLMVSSYTREGAKATLDALEAGAVDFIPKHVADLGGVGEDGVARVLERLKIIGRLGMRVVPGRRLEVPTLVPGSSREALPRAAKPADCRLIAVGTSTGGPAALQEVLTQLPGDFSIPIVAIQHMPADFTQAFAERLNELCKLSVKEAQDGDHLQPGSVLVAPGGRQMFVEARGARAFVRIVDSIPEQRYRPSVDVTFASAARAFAGKVLAVVLTGMGSDGRAGAQLLKNCGSTIWAQDEQSCVVYGMPMAIAKAGLADRILPLTDIGAALVGDL